MLSPVLSYERRLPDELVREAVLASTTRTAQRYAPEHPPDRMLIFAADVNCLGAVRRKAAFKYVVLGVTAAMTVLAWYLVRNAKPSELSTIQGVMLVGVLLAALLAGGWSQWRKARLLDRMARRPGSLLPAILELASPPHTFDLCLASNCEGVFKPVDDHVWCAGDPSRKLLLIEGVRYRYVIPADCIVRLSPFGRIERPEPLPTRHERALAIRLDVMAGEHVLGLVLRCHNPEFTPKGARAEDHAQHLCDELLLSMGTSSRMKQGLPPESSRKQNEM